MASPTPVPQAEKTFAQAVPEYIRIYGFDVLNLGAYYCAAGPALGLYIKYLGGSPTFMGLVMACMPACQLLQLFVAPHLERWGVKRTMVTSLALRNVMHTLLALLPFLAGWLAGAHPAGGTPSPLSGGVLSHPAALVLPVLFVIMLGFDMCQGLGFAGWMTWVNWLVPEKYRGRYFAFEQMMNNLGQMCFSAVAGWILGDQGNHGNYGSLFLLGALCGWASLAFLGRITAIPKRLERPEFQSLNLSWMKDVWKIKPFRRMMYVIWAHQLMLSVGYFFVYFQKDILHLTDRFLMVMNTVGIAGGLLSVYIWGNLADRFGSKPVMALAYYLILGTISYWVLLALGIPLYQKPMLILAQFLFIAGLQGYVVTNMRYVLGSLPQERVVFGTVFYNLTVQVSTMVGAMLWGRILDLSFIKTLGVTFGNLRLDRFGIVFGCMLLLATITRVFLHRLENRESRATSVSVAWYALRKDRVTRVLLLFLALGLAALPLSYLVQPADWRQTLGLGGYCLDVLNGFEGATHPARVQPAFWAVMAACLLIGALLCAWRWRGPKQP
jgi:MFS family permease